jgi:flavin-binding protein dodecin
MNRFAAVPLTLIVLVLGLVACGGGDSGAPSKADFAANANKICQDADKELQDLAAGSSRAQITQAIDKAIDQTQNSVDKLKALERPDGDAGQAADKFVNAVQTDIEKNGIPVLKDLRDAFKNNDQKAVQKAVQRLQGLETTDSSKLARDIGAKACAN